MKKLKKKVIVISVDVEEWYHSKWFDIKKMGYRPNDFTTDTYETLDLLNTIFADHSVNATFFTLTDQYEKNPHVFEKIKDQNHELGLHGMEHNGITYLGDKKFEEQIKEGKKRLEQKNRAKITGYRAPNQDINSNALNILSQNGFQYDSSIVPCHRIPGWYGSPNSPLFPHKTLQCETRDYVNQLVEFPIAVQPTLRIPGGGGWYFRNFGYNWVKHTLTQLVKKGNLAVFYIHPWEISIKNPALNGIPFHVFRKTGNWTTKALNSLLNHFKNKVSYKTFNQCIEEGLLKI